MANIILVTPSVQHEAAALDYINEHRAAGEHELHGASLLEQLPTYADWLTHIKTMSSEATVREGRVPSSTFFAFDADTGRLVGTIDIRHRLNDALAAYGGHIGYGVRPTERCKGYGTRMLVLGLEHCRTLGIAQVMVCCNSINIASASVITANGGQLTREFTHTDGRDVQVYKIEIGK